MAASRVGFIWIYVLIVLFAVGIMELILMPAIQYQLLPALQQSANMTLPAADAEGFATNTANTIKFMHMAMYMVMLVLFIYAIVSVFKREENDFYQP